MQSTRGLLLSGVAMIAAVPVAALAAPAPTMAERQAISLPAMPLAEALEKIRQQTGATLYVDPDAVKGATSSPVDGARDALSAVRAATRGANVAVQVQKDGSILVANDVVIVARRNEAEDNVLVRGQTSSSRTGESLRDQPRTVQVLSAKLLAEQQAQTLPDALRNAGGVTVNTATVQGGVAYSVRGFTSGGAVNGLPTPSSSTFAAGSTQGVANIERLEVLKGPDAILLGGDSLGGTVNIVTKKPSADTRYTVGVETGSYGQFRATGDANGALTSNKQLTARVIATSATADRNWGGYRGNKDQLLAPSLRFKNANTDIIASVTMADQIFGMVPYTMWNPATKKPYAIDPGQPIIGGKNQYVNIKGTTYELTGTQRIAPWLTVSGHYQHQNTSLLMRQYSPFAVLAPNGLLLVSSSGVKQHNANDAFDGYARIAFDTGPVQHKLVVGGMHYKYRVTAESAVAGPGSTTMFAYNFLTRTDRLYPIPDQYSFSDRVSGTQTSYFAQYLAKFWKVALSASVRKSDSKSVVEIVRQPTKNYTSNGATTPSFGAVLNVTDDLSVYGLLAYGFIPSFQTDRLGALLPDIDTRNIEGGVKLDLFGKRVLVNASYFNLRQSNVRVNDPVNRRYQIALPGQLGKGIDLSISGEPLKGWLVSGSFTRTDYSFIRPDKLGNTVTMVPRDQYSLYTSYRHRLSGTVTAGLGAGTYGRSSAAVDNMGTTWIAPTNQVDLNAFMTVGKLDLNLGLRNVFDRANYGITPSTSYVPIGEPRSWRLTMNYRFR